MTAGNTGDTMDGKLRTLIVDDSFIMRQFIHKMLEKYFNVEVLGHAEDGKKALEMFRETNPDYVTLDITMPLMDGISVLQSMLEIKPSAKIMIVTALSDKETALRALKIGAKNLIIKPFAAEKLKEAFGRLIEKN